MSGKDLLEIFQCSQPSSARELDEYHSIDNDAWWKKMLEGEGGEY